MGEEKRKPSIGWYRFVLAAGEGGGIPEGPYHHYEGGIRRVKIKKMNMLFIRYVPYVPWSDEIWEKSARFSFCLQKSW